MTAAPDHNHPTPEDLRDIQGDIVGFNKDHQRLMFITFPDQPSGRRFCAGMVGEVNHAAEVKAANERFSERRKSSEDRLTEENSWVNLGISSGGLTQVAADGIQAFPLAFQQGMRPRAALIGDVDTSDPSTWVGPFANGQPPVHAMIILAADSPALLDDRTAAVRAVIQQAGVSGLGIQDGNTRPADQAGHEHFGFKDGISQPSIAGVTRSSKGGGEIAAGEFLIGYENEDGEISGQGVAQAPQPTQPGDAGYPNAVTPPVVSLPDWARNGSFLVFRRLRQDVGGFRSFLGQAAPQIGLSAEQLGARLVGRWPSGAPLEHVVGEPTTTDALATDPSAVNSAILEDEHINKFGYAQDPDGHLTSRAAHIRKTNPRDEQPPGGEEADRHRILRRGIVYGPEFVETEPPYGGGVVPDTQDRGLLFMCFQASIERGFEFIQGQWANKPDFPQAGDGRDPIISQDVAAPQLALPPNNPHVTTARWVTTTGGEYFFAPSISALRHLGG